MSVHTCDLPLKQLSPQPESCTSSKEGFFQVVFICAYVHVIAGVYNIMLFSNLQEFSLTVSSGFEKMHINLLLIIPEIHNNS